ncbi:DUF6916 family protein [Arenimonas alkanexedens]
MHLLTVDDFAGCLNQSFHAALSDGEIEFVLVEARPLDKAPPNALRQPFSLLFRNSAALLFPQQTYRMRHPRGDHIDMFLVPIARETEGFLYQAIFN